VIFSSEDACVEATLYRATSTIAPSIYSRFLFFSTRNLLQLKKGGKELGLPRKLVDFNGEYSDFDYFGGGGSRS
jgi:hypothetical protein